MRKLCKEAIREEAFREKLRQKAEEARVFCKENGFNGNFCFLVDMGRHSGKYRFFVWDFQQDTIVDAGLCAHGYGKRSTPRRPVFSNEPGSYCTSLGKYRVGVRAYSNWGVRFHYKMHGLESTNDAAFSRIVVLHSHDPVEDTESYPRHMPFGYSQGCPVVSNEFLKRLDARLKKSDRPVLLWIYK